MLAKKRRDFGLRLDFSLTIFVSSRNVAKCSDSVTRPHWAVIHCVFESHSNVIIP